MPKFSPKPTIEILGELIVQFNDFDKNGKSRPDTKGKTPSVRFFNAYIKTPTMARYVGFIPLLKILVPNVAQTDLSCFTDYMLAEKYPGKHVTTPIVIWLSHIIVLFIICQKRGTVMARNGTPCPAASHYCRQVCKFTAIVATRGINVHAGILLGVDDDMSFDEFRQTQLANVQDVFRISSSDVVRASPVSA